jgi:curved DNA-binding protein CbpA
MPFCRRSGRRVRASGDGPVTRDHYAVLGVSPASEDVVIRAAYRALMQRYHPDADPSSEASQRAQAINAAYAVLGDPEKRARYDGSLAAQGLIKPEPQHRSSLARRMTPGPAGLVGLTALAATATLIAIAPPIGVLPEDGLPLPAEPRSSVTGRPQGADPASTTRRNVTGDDAPARSTAEPTRNQVANAMLDPPEEVVALEEPDPPAARPMQTERSRRKAVTVPPAVVPRSEKPAVAATEAAATCRLGNGWADRTICNSSNLAALDRQHGMLYAQSWARADEAKRAALLGSRGRFQEKRNACRSESCLTSAYVARLREISDIMARGVQQ